MLKTMHTLKAKMKEWNLTEKEEKVLSGLLDREIEKEEIKKANKKDKLEKDSRFINQIIELLKNNEKGLLAREIAAEMEISTQKVTYLIKLIENVDRKPDNKVYRYFIINE